ncbi:LysR family transcriptional regulator ArgP [Isoptericola variabilis]|uniref:Transcriptional regulator, ArgP, LysR family n=1 Tax=Isoptericola variabilis (strain 225) TaxID=743718 RepID=F6FPZ1_ISOV2|nr:LysR family transcriptional regulator ArgP [Isoptericola variabilis]AEG43780.1 transcriptional regulator, ArgP, LysR family [Isoptericola variabilis 225]TWH27462.1 LysR family transcriptional regulator (chromosome initiation inhibitor) [Isoptericola variabilis J7]
MRWDSGQLEALAAVVAEGSFDAAARALHITPSAVSQRIRALENAAGSVLVRRTRPVEPTDQGRTLLRLARQVELLGAEAARELGPAAADPADDDARPVTVPLAVNSDSLTTWLMPALARVDGVCFDLHTADQDRTVDLLPAGVVMAAVTSQREPVQGCTSVPLGTMRYRPAAARSVVERWFPDGPTLEALGRAPVVVFDRTDDLQDRWLRDVAAAAGAPVPDPPRHHVPSTASFLEAIRLGLGWGMWGPLPRPGARFPLLDDAADVVMLDDDSAVDVPLYLQQWKLRSEVLDRVAGALRAEARRTLLPL